MEDEKLDTPHVNVTFVEQDAEHFKLTPEPERPEKIGKHKEGSPQYEVAKTLRLAKEKEKTAEALAIAAVEGNDDLITYYRREHARLTDELKQQQVPSGQLPIMPASAEGGS